MTHKVTAALLSCAAALAPVRAFAENYYVNSRIGNDSSDGTTRQKAWKSFANLETHHFAPGDSILFAKGTRYVGGFTFKSSGVAGRPIVFSSYSMSADVVRSVDRTKIKDLIPAVYLTSVRVAESQKSICDELSGNGRWATQGILFDVGKADMKDESTPM